MKSFALSLVAIALMAVTASAQCGVQRSSQLDQLNLSLGQSACANGQCNLAQRAAASSSAVAAPAPIVQPQVLAYSAPIVQQYTASTMPLYVVQPQVAQLISTPAASASSAASTASASASAVTAPSVATQQLVVPQLVQPIQAQQVSACSNGRCGGGLLKALKFRQPRSRTRSVAVSRS